MLETNIKLVALDVVRGLPVMELAMEYPSIGGDEETDLIASVEANGIRQPLILFEDINDSQAQHQLLDGRNRLAAAIKVELEEIPIRYFVGTIEEAEDLIIDQNEKRRHLLPVQRAYIAEKHSAIVAKRAEARKLANLKQGTVAPESTSLVRSETEPKETGRTSTIVAQKHNAGRQSVETVQRIRRVAEEVMPDPDSDGEVRTPRALRAQSTLNKMKDGKITVTDAVKTVFGDPGQDINPDDQSKVSTGKNGLGKIVTELNKFEEFADAIIEFGNNADRAFVSQKLFRLTESVAQLNRKYGDLEDVDNLLDPEENRDYWSAVEERNH
jgi:ParB-like chromosome segregation protein Spo0J